MNFLYYLSWMPSLKYYFLLSNFSWIFNSLWRITSTFSAKSRCIFWSYFKMCVLFGRIWHLDRILFSVWRLLGNGLTAGRFQTAFRRPDESPARDRPGFGPHGGLRVLLHRSPGLSRRIAAAETRGSRDLRPNPDQLLQHHGRRVSASG